MAFLDKTGLEHLWAHIVSRLGSKADKTELEKVSKFYEAETGTLPSPAFSRYVWNSNIPNTAAEGTVNYIAFISNETLAANQFIVTKATGYPFYKIYNGTEWIFMADVAASTFANHAYQAGEPVFVKLVYGGTGGALSEAYLLTQPIASTEPTWQNGTAGSIEGLVPQYKKNGNLVTVRFSGLPASSISTGTKIGSVPYACGDIDSYIGTHFAVGTWGSGIYDIQMKGTDIYFYQMLYGENNLNLYVSTFQFTYSI